MAEASAKRVTGDHNKPQGTMERRTFSSKERRLGTRQSWYTVCYCRIKHKLSKPKSAMQIITQRCWSENRLSGFKLTIFLQKMLIDQMTSWHYFIRNCTFFSVVCKMPLTSVPEEAGRISQGTQKYSGAEKFVLLFKVPSWHWGIVKLCPGLKNCISN